MKHLSKKFMLSIVAIALVVIALGTSTFAWFTLSNKASVGQFNAEVTAGEGMELSLDGITWYSAIPADVMQAKIETLFTANGALNNEGEPILSAVTTSNLTTEATNDVDKFVKMDIANKVFVEAKANEDFIKVPIMVRAIELTKVKVESISLTGADTPWLADASFKHANTADITINNSYAMSAANGARVAIKEIDKDSRFVFENIAKGGAVSPTILNGSSNTVGASAPANGLLFLDTDPGYKAALLDQANPGQEKYFVEKTGLNMRTFTGYPEGSVIAASTTAGADILTLVSDGTGYNKSSFNLYIWFEGFDFDTYDAILKMPLSVSLSLEGRN